MATLPTPEQIASWPTPNYVNPETRQPLVLGVEIPLVVLVVIFTVMRFYSRTVVIRALGLDDWFMLAASASSVATSIMTCISTQNSIQTGYHLWDLRPEIAANPRQTAQMAMATQLMFIPITAFTKVSILLTYLRIFPSRTNKNFCYILLGFTVVWSFSSFFVALFQCKPVQAYWLVAEFPNRKCLDIAPLYYVTGCLNILSDFLIFLWPAKDLAQIRISLKQRVTLIAMFSLGVIICIAGICRIFYTFVFINSYDALYEGATLYTIVAIETSIGIICGCLPACKPLMSKMLPHIFTSTRGSTQKKTGMKVSGQPFPFQTLNGGIAKEEAFSVQYTQAMDDEGKRVVSRIECKTEEDGDAASAGSGEWIMMQDNPRMGVARSEGTGEMDNEGSTREAKASLQPYSGR